MSSGQMTTVAVCFIHTIIKRNLMIRCELFCLILVILFVFALVLCIIFLFFSFSFCYVVILLVLRSIFPPYSSILHIELPFASSTNT